MTFNNSVAQDVRPAFLAWDKPTEGQTLKEWQAGRCAYCGLPDDQLVLDHDHDTGLCRGYLDRGCNISEGHADERWDVWRTGTNPCDMYFGPEVYLGLNGRPMLTDITGPDATNALFASRGDAAAMEQVLARREEVYTARRAGETVPSRVSDDVFDRIANAVTDGYIPGIDD